jgi:hypothetical protein
MQMPRIAQFLHSLLTPSAAATTDSTASSAASAPRRVVWLRARPIAMRGAEGSGASEEEEAVQASEAAAAAVSSTKHTATTRSAFAFASSASKMAAATPSAAGSSITPHFSSAATPSSASAFTRIVTVNVPAPLCLPRPAATAHPPPPLTETAHTAADSAQPQPPEAGTVPSLELSKRQVELVIKLIWALKTIADTAARRHSAAAPTSLLSFFVSFVRAHFGSFTPPPPPPALSVSTSSAFSTSALLSTTASSSLLSVPPPSTRHSTALPAADPLRPPTADVTRLHLSPSSAALSSLHTTASFAPTPLSLPPASASATQPLPPPSAALSALLSPLASASTSTAAAAPAPAPYTPLHHFTYSFLYHCERYARSDSDISGFVAVLNGARCEEEVGDSCTMMVLAVLVLLLLVGCGLISRSLHCCLHNPLGALQKSVAADRCIGRAAPHSALFRRFHSHRRSASQPTAATAYNTRRFDAGARHHSGATARCAPVHCQRCISLCCAQNARPKE